MTHFLMEAERIDVWVFRVGFAFLAVCLGALVIWNLLVRFGKRNRPRTPVRESPEPSRTVRSEPEQLERACASLIESLARKYLELAESWQRNGQPRQAVAVLEQLLQRCPETREAQLARDRLRELGQNKSAGSLEL